MFSEFAKVRSQKEVPQFGELEKVVCCTDLRVVAKLNILRENLN